MAEPLIDSNVLIAALVENHQHHGPSSDLLFDNLGGNFAVAAHSYAEAFNQLTKPGGPYRRSPALVRDGLRVLRAGSRLVGLTPQQSVDAIERYADLGGVGARLYDYLIGEAGRRAGLRMMITWNVSHMRGLFPDLDILSPVEVAERF